MVSLNLELPTEFFEEEVRCDYLISKQMKEIWAVELDLFNQLIHVCKKYKIKYYVIGGTLLGTIRHKGYIPWDDDIDVVMSRIDYIKLCKIAETEFQYPYFFQTDETDYGFFRPFARLRNSQTTGIQKNEVGMKIPYNQGIFIDIFPYDNIPDEPMERKRYIEKLSKLQKRAWMLSSITIRYQNGYSKGMKGIIKRLICPALRWCFLKFKIGNLYWKQWEKEVQKYNNIPTKEIGVMYVYREDEFAIWKEKYFLESELVSFEMLKVNAPKQYEKILKKQYGEWKKFVIGNNIHGEMYFDTSKSYKEYLDEK